MGPTVVEGHPTARRGAKETQAARPTASWRPLGPFRWGAIVLAMFLCVGGGFTSEGFVPVAAPSPARPSTIRRRPRSFRRLMLKGNSAAAASLEDDPNVTDVARVPAPLSTNENDELLETKKGSPLRRTLSASSIHDETTFMQVGVDGSHWKTMERALEKEDEERKQMRIKLKALERKQKKIKPEALESMNVVFFQSFSLSQNNNQDAREGSKGMPDPIIFGARSTYSKIFGK
eukprot:GHVT01091672.1.p1 GENE.GHVT01091672.1~~GHVT01091672.1.p1  ORF type:complete len:233 (+),score=35.76 GHVT01091672.1:369-1067(+)